MDFHAPSWSILKDDTPSFTCTNVFEGLENTLKQMLLWVDDPELGKLPQKRLGRVKMAEEEEANLRVKSKAQHYNGMLECLVATEHCFPTSLPPELEDYANRIRGRLGILAENHFKPMTVNMVQALEERQFTAILQTARHEIPVPQIPQHRSGASDQPSLRPPRDPRSGGKPGSFRKSGILDVGTARGSRAMTRTEDQKHYSSSREEYHAQSLNDSSLEPYQHGAPAAENGNRCKRAKREPSGLAARARQQDKDARQPRG
jgi:hypothetical protein